MTEPEKQDEMPKAYKPDSGFDVDTNRVIIIDKKGKTEELPLMSKREVADKVLDRVKGITGK